MEKDWNNEEPPKNTNDTNRLTSVQPPEVESTCEMIFSGIKNLLDKDIEVIYSDYQARQHFPPSGESKPLDPVLRLSFVPSAKPEYIQIECNARDGSKVSIWVWYDKECQLTYSYTGPGKDPKTLTLRNVNVQGRWILVVEYPNSTQEQRPWVVGEVDDPDGPLDLSRRPQER